MNSSLWKQTNKTHLYGIIFKLGVRLCHKRPQRKFYLMKIELLITWLSPKDPISQFYEYQIKIWNSIVKGKIIKTTQYHYKYYYLKVHWLKIFINPKCRIRYVDNEIGNNQKNPATSWRHRNKHELMTSPVSTVWTMNSKI